MGNSNCIQVQGSPSAVDPVASSANKSSADASPRVPSSSSPPPSSPSSNKTESIEIEVLESSTPSSIVGDNFQIPLKIYQPKNSVFKNDNSTSNNDTSDTKNDNENKNNDVRCVMFFIHGGIFSLGDCHSHPTIATALAQECNAIVVTASFRNGEDAPWKSGVCQRDLLDVCSFCHKEICDKFKFDSKNNNNINASGTASETKSGSLPFGLVGSSSGGFFALILSNSPPQIQTQTQQHQSHLPKLPKIAFCIPICPVADPYRRASYLRSSIAGTVHSDGYTSTPSHAHTPEKSKFILEKQLSFWENDAFMKDAARLLKDRNTNTTTNNNVPTLLILGSCDKNVPLVVTQDVQSWATRTVVIGGRGHELCDDISDIRGGYQCYLPDVKRFLDYCFNEHNDIIEKGDVNNERGKGVEKEEKKEEEAGGTDAKEVEEENEVGEIITEEKKEEDEEK